MEHAIKVLQNELSKLQDKLEITQDKVIKHLVKVRIESVKRALAMITE